MKSLLMITLLASSATKLFGQAADSSSWEFEADGNFYFLPGDFFFLPIVLGDHDKLHLEARYNYEDRQTVSTWVGYNFYGGKKLEYFITPMVGVVGGLTRGVTTGLEITLNWRKFEFYSESEFLIDPKLAENNFYYHWADMTYSVNDWLSAGLSAQRTKLYKTNLDLQRGLLAEINVKQWTFKGYLYNLGFDDPFGIFTINLTF